MLIPAVLVIRVVVQLLEQPEWGLAVQVSL